MFVEILNQVTYQILRECQGSKNVDDYLFPAIRIWCQQFNLTQHETQYILNGYCQDEINELTNYIYQEWEAKSFLANRSKFYNLAALNVIKGRKENIKFIVLIAFGITAVGYCIYRLNQPKRTTSKEESKPYNLNSISPIVQTPIVQTTPIERITKQFLVLVVSASQADFLESLYTKRRIDFSDGEALYEITKYLWLGSETDFNQRRDKSNRYSVSNGKESEYDIYLVYIELKRVYEGFKSNVDPLDRYDAFRKLSDLASNVEISPRLQMEAYGNFDVYNR